MKFQKYPLRYIILTKAFVLILCTAQGQTKEYRRFETRPIHDDYIVDYSDQLSVKLYGILKSNKIAHVSQDTDKKIEYKPNENLNIGFGLGYKWLGLDLAFNLSGVNSDDDQFGKTKRFDIQSNIYTRKFAIDLNWQSYCGYYASNPGTYMANFDPDRMPYPLRPDIKTVNYGISAMYIFKHDKFSFRSAFTYNERQVKSAGSFMAGPYLSYYRMDADSSLIPVAAEEYFDTSVDFRGNEYIGYGFSGGYGYNLVVGKRVFFSATLAIGLGPEIKKTPSTHGQKASTEAQLTGRLSVRTALGYNSERFFSGISAVGVFLGERQEKEDFLERGIAHIKLFIGHRFRPHSFIKSKKQ